MTRQRSGAKRHVATVLACAVAAAAALAGAAVQSQADRERTDAAQKRTADRLRALQREADALVDRERTLLVELRKLEIDRQISIERLAQIERDRLDTATRLEAAEARAAELARQAEAQAPDVEARLVHLYKLGRAGYWRLLLNAQDIQALGRAYRTASVLTAIDRARVTEHYATLDALARERKALQDRAGEIARLQADAVRARASLDKAVAARSALVKSIDARRDLNAQLMGELQAAQQKLQASLSQLDAGRGAAPVLPLRPFQGDLPWPARGTVARRFGRQPSSQPGAAIVRNGMDVSMAEGQPVRSVHEGTVAYADQFAGYGNLVIVDHGGRSYSLYGYLGSMDVARGERVETGATLGASGRDPSGNPALYFELRVDGAAVDPLQWLRK